MLAIDACGSSAARGSLNSGRSTRTQRSPLRTWFSFVEHASWSGPAQIRSAFGSADFLAGNRVVFNIKGNAYRIVAQVKYGPLFLVFIRFVGTHAEYDRIDATSI